MQELNMVEVDYVSGGRDMQVVVIHGKRMTAQEMAEYDNMYLVSDTLMAIWDWFTNW